MTDSEGAVQKAVTNRRFRGTIHAFEIAPAMIRLLESLIGQTRAENPDAQSVLSMLRSLEYTFYCVSYDVAAGRLTLAPLGPSDIADSPCNIFAATEKCAATLFA